MPNKQLNAEVFIRNIMAAPLYHQNLVAFSFSNVHVTKVKMRKYPWTVGGTLNFMYRNWSLL